MSKTESGTPEEAGAGGGLVAVPPLEPEELLGDLLEEPEDDEPELEEPELDEPLPDEPEELGVAATGGGVAVAAP
ncbi:hypothetical protein L6R49_19525, partial [Myxococcota bacterium]|nr:hypothetical protein [Myxococcota bacterium]